MRSLTAGGLAALWLAAAVASAQPPAAKAERPDKDEGSWWSGLFGGKKAQAKKPAAEPTKTVADKSAEHDRLRRAYMRRLMVCTRLREVALESGNDALEDEANRLEKMAWRLYTEGSAKLLGGAAVGMDADEREEDEVAAARPARKLPAGGSLPPRLRNGGAMEARSGTAREDER